jgi:hypothetical protein
MEALMDLLKSRQSPWFYYAYSKGYFLPSNPRFQPLKRIGALIYSAFLGGIHSRNTKGFPLGNLTNDIDFDLGFGIYDNHSCTTVII